MNKELIRIQKGYLLIEKARNKIRVLSESKDIQDERKKLQDMKTMEDEITENTNNLKNKIFENEEKLLKKEKELNQIIKYLYSNSKKETKDIKDKKKRQKEIEEERNILKKEILEFFLKVDALKEEMNDYKINYNEMEKSFLKKLSLQNAKIVKYEDKITFIEKKIRKIRKGIDSVSLSIYDKKRQKSILVMSKIDQNKCKSCGLELEEDIIQKIAQDEIIECPHCGKILYIETEEIEEEKNV
ncbi:hypothetical protein HMPREF9630_01042 [Peptoanaerobacter stomatis]|uniref:Zinc ribbon domain protein n=1 Tax=Peptoanaerobacter stomatis TaxID=796937 RepID=J5WI84_9FIRM|nr:hypothetical protein [Peptoanaerobacter stomatis]EHL14593.1 hypothetical protein HMPREF9630_01042 [Peptoanaerobacter stomatis]EJU22112.1 zinc ribbon domain protein [Peptoanaerobacter stomatis]NWO24907.1 hypothetical protein [Peptostreptococcaceae bacterium oral taxon 081]